MGAIAVKEEVKVPTIREQVLGANIRTVFR